MIDESKTEGAVPGAASLTSAPLRHTLEVLLEASVTDVWALVGNHERLPEYCGGIERVEVEPDGSARVCIFRSPDPDAAGMPLREVIRWQDPMVGYSTSAAADNAFGLRDDLSIVTLTDAGDATVFLWRQYYEHPDLPVARQSFHEGLKDIGARLAAHFGGRVIRLDSEIA